MADNFNVASQSVSELSTNKVLRNTYALLGFSLIPTLIGALMGMSMNFGFAAQSPILFFIITLGAMFGMFYLIRANRNSSLGVVFLLGLTFLMGILLGPILQVAFSLSNGGQIVGLAAGGTATIFLVLSGIATTSNVVAILPPDIIARDPSINPANRLPPSPKNIFAGCQFHMRNPNVAPAKIIESNATSG